MPDTSSTPPLDRRLDDLLERNEFARRHIGATSTDLATMCAALGVADTDALIAEALPAAIRSETPDPFHAPSTESAALTTLRSMADKNQVVTSMIGQGYANTITPPVIQRNVLEDPAWYTAYTPYQPEISQGRLEALLNFQTMVSELTGLEVANASLLDEATAAAEAMTMARRLSKSKSDRFVVDADIHPQTLAVLRTRAEPVDVDLVVADVAADPSALDDDLFGALFSYPTSTGGVVDWRAAIDTVHEHRGIAIVATDPLACTVLTSPGDLGADIAVGSAQRFGVPLGYGGPHAAFLAAHDRAARAIPGRLVGVSPAPAGRPGSWTKPNAQSKNCCWIKG